jgi:hypothetical protein
MAHPFHEDTRLNFNHEGLMKQIRNFILLVGCADVRKRIKFNCLMRFVPLAHPMYPIDISLLNFLGTECFSHGGQS